MPERRWDRIMRLIGEGRSDEEIILIIAGIDKRTMHTYRLAHDKKNCRLPNSGREPKEGRHYIPSTGMRGTLMRDGRTGIRGSDWDPTDIMYFDD